MRYGMYLKSTGGGGQCALCGNSLENGDLYVRITTYRAWPYLHQKCMRGAADKLDQKEPDLKKKYDEKVNKIKAEKAAKKTNRSWKKSIIKEALKTKKILISKISVTTPSDRGTGNVIRIAEKNATYPFVFLFIDGDQVTITPPLDEHGNKTTWIWNLKRKAQANKLKKQETIALNDPEALQKLGDAILRLSYNDQLWSKYVKK